MLNHYTLKAIAELIESAHQVGWFEGYEHVKKEAQFSILLRDAKERQERMERILKEEIESAIKDAIEALYCDQS